MPAPAPRNGLYRNRMSQIGGGIGIVTGLLILLASLYELGATDPNPMVGVVAYFGLPCIMVGGGLVFLWGLRREVLRRRQEPPSAARSESVAQTKEPPRRTHFVWVLSAASIAAALLALTGVQATRFSGSLAFCAKTCHEPMKPTYRAHRASAHETVACADCHVGAGLSGFVLSKVSGLRKAWAVTGGSYDRPIVASHGELPPTGETCTRCHAPPLAPPPETHRLTIFRPDEANTAEQIELSMKSSASAKATDDNVGIDWHHNLDNTITYVTLDEKQQQIPWLQVKRWDGNVTEYRAEGSTLTAEQLASLPRHRLDCVGCHNRTGHRFESPSMAVNRALAAQKIPATLPWVKATVTTALVRPYDSRETAHRGLGKAIETTYRDKVPELLATRPGDIQKAAAAAVAIYDRNAFPEMRVDWQTYPDNIGHRHWPGCFRCHDERHLAADDRPLSRSCTLCHSEPRRIPVGPGTDRSAGAADGWPPWDMPADHLEVKEHDQLLCHECHRPGQRPRSACVECHR
jgi:hypothetical protein